MENLNLDINEFNTFTDEEIAEFGLTEADLGIFKDAEALVQTVDMLPDDPDKLLNKIEKEIPDDIEAGFTKLTEILEKDQKFYAQIVALNEAINAVSEFEPQTEKLSLSDIQKEKDSEMANQILAQILSVK